MSFTFRLLFRLVLGAFLLTDLLQGQEINRVTRGPWLQTGTPSSIIVKWRTDAATDSLVEYGSDPEYLALAAADDLLTTEHEVQLTQLEPAHTYHYAIGSGARRLAGDSTYFFRTSPTPGSTNRFRLWI